MPANRILITLTLLSLLIFSYSGVSAQKKYHFQSFEKDPLGVRIYTLDNGLKVYMSVQREEPRIQTLIAVKVGSKHDPPETTGLAHYFEHMMFKGTPNFGTLDWENEKVLIQRIEDLYEIYRRETDPAKRAALYRQIDSISYLASRLAIPNEYDKLMTAIGSQGTNAATSNDYTIYIENIPSNQLENWAVIQADRFTYPVLRLFHTELETVYEEYNMSLTNDSRKVSEAMLKGLFPNHPYGQQTTLGKAEHLKNPSMKNIREFFDKYYVANNMAVILAGDFDPDRAIEIIDRTLGKLRSGEVPELRYTSQPDINEPLKFEVTGLEAEYVQIAWRFDGAASEHIPLLEMISMILYNGKAGLIDRDLIKKQALLSASASTWTMADYSALVLTGRNKTGQSLDEVKELLLGQIKRIRNGDFPDWILEAAINNIRLNEMRRFESARSRAWMMANSFLNDIPWSRYINYTRILSGITREDIIRFARQHLGDNNYVVVYKRQGQPENLEMVEKPPITPVHINRDAESQMLKNIKSAIVPQIQPVFLDYQRDMARSTIRKGMELLYVKNTENPTFSLTYLVPYGIHNDRLLPFAAAFLNFLGTRRLSAEEVGNEFYKLACSYSISADEEETRITISGLSENFEKALKLFEELIAKATAKQEDLKQFVENTKKARSDSKANQRTNFQALTNYATYGKVNPTTFTLTDQELDALGVSDLTGSLRKLWTYEHTVIFYGPQSIDEVARLVRKHHKVPKNLQQATTIKRFELIETNDNLVYFAHYDANQSYLRTISRGEKFNLDLWPIATLYNSYFSGGMYAVVFQEMREKRGLAYSANSSYRIPSSPDGFFVNTSFIATQNDKVVEAFEAFNQLFDQIPVSEKAFTLAKEQLISDIRTQRITKSAILFSYLNDRKLGFDTDRRKILYEKLQSLTLDDVVAFSKQYISHRPKTYIILGHEDHLDFDLIGKKFGKVIRLTREDLFVY